MWCLQSEVCFNFFYGNFIAVRCMCDLSPLFALLGGGGGGMGGGDNCFIIFMYSFIQSRRTSITNQ